MLRDNHRPARQRHVATCSSHWLAEITEKVGSAETIARDFYVSVFAVMNILLTVWETS